jgi:hypothetical protein
MLLIRTWKKFAIKLVVVLSKKFDLKDRRTQRESLVQTVLGLASVECKCIALLLYKLVGLTAVLFADITFNNHYQW